MGEFGKGGPAGENNVDDHDGFGGRRPDEDVAWFVVGAFVRELQRLVANNEGVFFLEDSVGDWPGGVGVRESFKVEERLHMGNVVFDCFIKNVGAADVVGVSVAVNEMGYWFGGDTFDGCLKLVADCWRTVDGDDADVTDEEHGLVAAVSDKVGTTSQIFQTIAHLRVDRRS